MYLFFALAVPWHFHASPRQLLQLDEANRILGRAVLMGLEHPWKSQGKIPSVGQLVEASAHQFHYKWMFEELGWLECLENKDEVCRFNTGPRFRIIDRIDRRGISKGDILYLNQHGYFERVPFAISITEFDVKSDPT
jgi:hypothetical protein